jgi:hypothetical protein
MSKHKLIATLALVGFVSSPLVASAADPMGAVVAVDGRPTATSSTGSRALSAGSEVFEGDTITVGEGNAQMELDDGTKLVVGPSSRLLLQAYLRRNQSTAKKVGLKALRGTFRVITGNSPKSAYNISTSNATIGIRGTGFDFTVSNKTVLAVLKGAVRLRGSNGKAVNIGSGCALGQAGAGNVAANILSGQTKSNVLQNDLPFITGQSVLAGAFQLPVSACLPFLANNGGSTPTVPPGVIMTLPIIPGAFITKELFNDSNDPISAEGGSTNPPPPPPPKDPRCVYFPNLPICNP